MQVLIRQKISLLRQIIRREVATKRISVTAHARELWFSSVQFLTGFVVGLAATQQVFLQFSFANHQSVIVPHSFFVSEGTQAARYHILSL